MKKHYNQVMRSFIYGVALSIIVLVFSGIILILNGIYYVGSVELMFAVLVFGYFIFVRKNRIKGINEYLGIIATQGNTMSSDAICSLPLPMVILQIDGSIVWYNENFRTIFGEKFLFDVPIDTIVPNIKWSDILKSKNGISTNAYYNEHHYNIVGNIIKSKNNQMQNNGEEIYSVLLYFIDKTEQEEIQEKYKSEKTDIAIISIDNYDEILQKMDDYQRQQTISQIDKHINDWVSQSYGVLKKTERDRYIVLFEHQYLKNYIEKKFEVLDLVRTVGEGMKMPITISIGIGVGGHLSENEVYARSAIDMVLGRGGDQAAIKDEMQFNFYGGKTKEYEKSTRVKTRAFSVALKDYIARCDKVVFMGHYNADYDSFGACMGLQRAARLLGKKPYIVLDNSPAIKNVVDRVREKEEYDGMLIDSNIALDFMTENTLVVIVDTHRPSMLPCRELLDIANKVVLIDHHRRSTEFIQNCSLIYHEPYASSTCEMVTEILQYMDDTKKMTTFEAEALYVGLIMDTKNFVVKTGVRTFEAASALRRYGVDTMLVKQLFSINKTDYSNKADIVRQAQMVTKDTAIAVCNEHFENIKVISSQAADEMLNIDGIKAGFVIYSIDNNDVGISGRSVGDVNVQVILEKLGGGGHMTVAGAKIKGESMESVKNKLEKAILEYDKENDK